MLDNHKLVKELNDALLEEVKANKKAIANHIKKEKEFLVKIKNLKKGLMNKRIANIPEHTLKPKLQLILKIQY